MKADIHPDYHEITVQLPSGDTYQTRSTWGSAGDTLILDIDPSTHAAWTGGTQRIMDKGQVAKFRNKYAGFGLS